MSLGARTGEVAPPEGMAGEARRAVVGIMLGVGLGLLVLPFLRRERPRGRRRSRGDGPARVVRASARRV